MRFRSGALLRPLALILSGVALSGAALAGYRAARQIWPHTAPPEPWESDIAREVIRAARMQGSVVFLGDSLTAGLATSNVVARSENFGVAGETVEGLTARLETYDLRGARAIVVQIGINNWRTDRLAGFAGKYRALLHSLPGGTPIFAVSLTPAGRRAQPWFDARGFDDVLDATNATIRRLCDETPGCAFIDIATPLKGSDGMLHPAFGVDGLHLSAKGYALWEGALARRLATHGVSDARRVAGRIS